MGICGRVLGRFTGGGSDVGQPRSESSCIEHIWLGWRLIPAGAAGLYTRDSNEV